MAVHVSRSLPGQVSREDRPLGFPHSLIILLVNQLVIQ